MTDADLQAIRDREAKATPGPWYPGENSQRQYNVYGPNHEDITPAFTDDTFASMQQDDTVFIAHARADIPALLAEVERLRNKLADYHCASCDGSCRT